ncbi:hypothetical protein Tco_0690574, partial [Tanacetum coccineum]
MIAMIVQLFTLPILATEEQSTTIKGARNSVSKASPSLQSSLRSSLIIPEDDIQAKGGGEEVLLVASKGLKSPCDGCLITKSWITCVNTSENTTLSEAQGVSLRITSGVRFRRRPPAKGVGLRVANSHTGNHPEDDFTPLKTIRRSYSVNREKFPFELEWETFEPERGGEFNDFLALYPIPSEYHVILPKSNQIVFYAPPGYVGLYTYSFSLANLRLPLTEFFCEPMVVSPLSTSSEGSLICVELQNKLDLKSFKDKLPPNIEENPMFQNLSRYPTSVRVFPDPIIFLAGLKPSWEH